MIMTSSLRRIMLLLLFVLSAAGCTLDKEVQTPAVGATGTTGSGEEAGGKGIAATPASLPADTAVAGADSAAGTALAGGTVSFDTSAVHRFSAPVSFTVAARVMGDTVYLQSTDLSDQAGFVCAVPPGKSEAGAWGPGRYDIDVMRFAHFGRADSPFAFQWVLYMPKDEGEILIRPVSGNSRKMEVTLRGPLHFDVLLKGATKPITMITKFYPEFKGISSNGSPQGVTLRLANGPVGFFRDEYINDTATKAMVTVLETTFTFGKRPTNYFTKLPEIVTASVVGPSGGSWKEGKIGGVKLEWKPTADLLKPITIAGYNVYRSPTPEKPGSWKLVAKVPPGQRSVQDKGYDGTRRMAYIVTHRTDYPVGFTYEGIGARPAIVEPVGGERR